jgi:hypothetical protein
MLLTTIAASTLFILPVYAQSTTPATPSDMPAASQGEEHMSAEGAKNRAKMMGKKEEKKADAKAAKMDAKAAKKAAKMNAKAAKMDAKKAKAAKVKAEKKAGPQAIKEKSLNEKKGETPKKADDAANAGTTDTKAADTDKK